MADKGFTTFDEFVAHSSTISDLRDRAQFLREEKHGFIKTHSQQLLDILEVIRSEAGQKRLQAAENEALSGIGKALENLTRLDDALGAYQSALTYFEAVKDADAIGYLYYSMGFIHFEQGNVQKAVDFLFKSLKAREQLEDRLPAAGTLVGIGRLYTLITAYDKGVEYFQKALRIAREIGHKRLQHHASANLAAVSVLLEDFAHAESYYKEAVAICEELGDLLGKAVMQLNLAESYSRQRKHQECVDLVREALETFRELPLPPMEARALGVLGKNLDALDPGSDQALDFLLEALDIARKLDDVDVILQSSADIAGLYYDRADYTVALDYLNSALELINSKGGRAYAQYCYQVLSKVHAALDSYKKAYQFRERSEELIVQSLGEERQKAIAELQVRFDLESTLKEKEIYRLRNEQLEMIMEQRSKELAGMALHLVEKAELIESFGKQVKKIARSAQKDARTMAERLLEDIDQQNLSEDWSRFEQQFDQTQGSFVRTLLAAFPDLTPTEMRIASLLKIGLSTKEIASLLNVSDRNIESHRYHVRKKLGLQANQTIVAFLRGFEEDHASRRAVSEDQSFSTALSATYPDLSETELKVCTLTRNGLTTKEIAEFLGSSERTVEAHRYKIRRKIDLQKGQNLQAFLKGLS